MGHIHKHEFANTLPHPGKCHDCGYNGPDREFYVDTGVETEWDGRIVFCSACLLNLLVKTYGFDPFKVMEEVKTANYKRNLQLEMDSQELRRLRQGLAILGLSTTSVIRLAGFMEEEQNGNTRDQPSISAGPRVTDRDSEEGGPITEPTLKLNESIGTAVTGDSDSGNSNRKPNRTVKPSLQL